MDAEGRRKPGTPRTGIPSPGPAERGSPGPAALGAVQWLKYAFVCLLVAAPFAALSGSAGRGPRPF
jgi:hypothetical protein